MDIDLTGEVALVTGASKGIGRAVAEAFRRAGANVAAQYRTGAPLEHCASFRADLQHEEEVRELHRQVVDKLGPVTILVNNAGIWEDNTAGNPEALERYRRLMAVNLDSAYLLCNLVVPAMKEKKRGVILNISSRAGKRGEERAAHYAISKGGMHAMTVSLARELAEHGIRVNDIAPGWIETPMTAEHLANPDTRAEVEGQTVMGSVGKPEDIAGAALFLASDRAAYITGQVLHISGGSYMNT
jgi:3-oxoacyl-[acyl-carrier protein] reductase